MAQAGVATWDNAASERVPSATVSREGERTVVTLSGEHDHATEAVLVGTIAGAISLDDADLVIDMADVEFIDSSTLVVLVRTWEFLRQRSRALVVRAPSARARRVLDAGGLAGLIAVQSRER